MATMAFLGVGLRWFWPGGGERLMLFGIDVREVWSLDLLKDGFTFGLGIPLCWDDFDDAVLDAWGRYMR
jgi:hypothetical protein